MFGYCWIFLLVLYILSAFACHTPFAFGNNTKNELKWNITSFSFALCFKIKPFDWVVRNWDVPTRKHDIQDRIVSIILVFLLR
jgi:hypothetical protein